MRVGIIGCGSIGSYLAETLHRGQVPGAELVALADLPEREEDLRRASAAFGCAYTTDALRLPDLGAQLVVEAASVAAARALAVPLLRRGVDLLLMSVGALADDGFLEEVRRAAQESGRRVYLPSGAIAGLDGVRAAAVAGIEEVVLVTRKPPQALRGAPGLRGIDLDAIREPTVVFEGSAREAIAGFPANVNVAISLSLAGIGPDRTRVRVVADPGIDRNIHEIHVRGPFGELKLTASNLPMPANPRTSFLAALSAVAALRRLASPIAVGS